MAQSETFRPLPRIVEHKIEMRDGVRLAAMVYLPPEAATAVPAIAAMTPYTADSLHRRGLYFASCGLVFAAVNVRGRGDSEGLFRPFQQEAKDACDVIGWLSRQPFCDGKVGMWGGSYLGYAQWAAIKERPPALVTIVPTAAPCMGVDFPMRRNISYPYLAQWHAFTSGKTARSNLFNDVRFWGDAYGAWFSEGRSFAEFVVADFDANETIAEWIDHPHRSSYWDGYNPSPGDYRDLSIPTLTITGSYDDDQPGALEHYKRLIANSEPANRPKHHLIIGPWDHGGTATPTAEFGGLRCGEESVVDMEALHRDWYNWTLRDGAKPPFLEKAVNYYVIGADEWRCADSLETITAATWELSLSSHGQVTGRLKSGDLVSGNGSGGPDSFTYDPGADDRPEIAAEAAADPNSLVDESVLLALDERCLSYVTAPLLTEIDLCGFIELRLWVAIDTPDTDFYVTVSEIEPSGRVLRLSNDAARARYRTGLAEPKLIETSEPLDYLFNGFTFIAKRIGRGSRIRLTLAPFGRVIGASFPQPNFNAGGEVSQETIADACPVIVRVYHDASRPSVLRLPLGRAKIIH